MASGTSYGSVTQLSSYFSFFATWSSVPNTAGNYSDVTVTTYWSTNNTYRTFDTVSARNASITINGNTYSTSQRFNMNPWPSNPYAIMSHTVRVNHDDNGSKQIYISARANGHASDYGPSSSVYEGGDCTVGFYATLDSIPRASSVTATPNSLIPDGEQAVTVTIVPRLSTYSHVITYSAGEFNQSFALAAGVNSHSFAVPVAWLSAFPTSESGQLNISVQTKSGSTNIGAPATASVILDVPDYQMSVDIAITGNNFLETTCVATKSTLNVAITANSMYGATIASYLCKIDGINYTTASFTTQPLTAGTKEIGVTVMDSRGNRVMLSDVIDVIEYAPPTISSATVERCLADGTANTEGTYALISFVGNCSPVNNQNAKQYFVKIGSNSPIEILNDSYTINKTQILGDGLLSADNAYDFTFSIQDSFATVTKTVTMPVAAVTMDFHHTGKGVAFGKVSEHENRLEIADDWSLYVHGQEILDIAGGGGTSEVFPVGSIYMSINGTNPSSFFGGTWVPWGTGRVPVGIDTSQAEFNTIQKTGGAKTITLTTAQMPSHTHSQNPHGHRVRWEGSASYGAYHIPTSSGYNFKSENTWIENSTATNNYTGGNGAHSNLQPYITCYMWLRTA